MRKRALLSLWLMLVLSPQICAAASPRAYWQSSVHHLDWGNKDGVSQRVAVDSFDHVDSWSDPQHLTPQSMLTSSDNGHHAVIGATGLLPASENLQSDFTLPERASFCLLDFSLRSTFLQSVWFNLLCMVCVGMAAACVLRWRFRLATLRGEERMQVRLAERLRIARTLHDTFLQSQQALIMKMSLMKNRLPADDPVRAELEQLLNLAETVTDEGRQQVFALRSQEDYSGDVQAAVREIAVQLIEQYGLAVKVCVEGRSRLLVPHVAEQICAVIKEAMNNACRHSGSETVVVEMCYGRLSFVVKIIDTGAGISQEVLAADGKHGHWGLVGMRERAQQIGASLTISPGRQGGTAVKLKIAGSAAYPTLLRVA